MSTYRRITCTDAESAADEAASSSDSFEGDRAEISIEGDLAEVSIARPEPGWRNEPHDYAAEEREGIHVLPEGEATVVIDGESVGMEPGDAVWIPPHATRQLRNGGSESTFVFVGASASGGRERARTTSSPGR